ncbi:hypothetical protein GCM10009131_30380 [Morganella psychrotolerans]
MGLLIYTITKYASQGLCGSYRQLTIPILPGAAIYNAVGIPYFINVLTPMNFTY